MKEFAIWVYETIAYVIAVVTVFALACFFIWVGWIARTPSGDEQGTRLMRMLSQCIYEGRILTTSERLEIDNYLDDAVKNINTHCTKEEKDKYLTDLDEKEAIVKDDIMLLNETKRIILKLKRKIKHARAK